MTTEEKQTYLENIRRSKGYVLEMHRILSKRTWSG